MERHIRFVSLASPLVKRLIRSGSCLGVRLARFISLASLDPEANKTCLLPLLLVERLMGLVSCLWIGISLFHLISVRKLMGLVSCLSVGSLTIFVPCL